MLKRNIAILIATGLLGAQANLASAGDSPPAFITPAQLKYFEERAASIRAETRGDVYKTVKKVTAATKYVNVEHLGNVKFVNDKGQSFTWKADTLGEADIPLKTIAPAGFEAGEARVFVNHPLEHISGG